MPRKEGNLRTTLVRIRGRLSHYFNGKRNAYDERDDNELRAAIFEWLQSDVRTGAFQCAGVNGSSKATTPADVGIPRCNRKAFRGGNEYGGWIRYWVLMTGRNPPATCCIHGCTKPADKGLHVWIKGQKDTMRCYIIPGCAEHNSKGYDWEDGEPDYGWLQTVSGTSLVPAPTTNSMFSW